MAVCSIILCIYLAPRAGEREPLLKGRRERHVRAAERMPGLAARRVTRRQQQGAHAVVGWVGWDAGGSPVGRGLSVLEIRGGEIVFEAAEETAGPGA